MVARRKVTPEPVLKDWSQVDEALKEIAEQRDALAVLEAQLNERMAAVRAESEARMLPLSQRQKRLEKDVQEFTETHKADLEQQEGKRSKALNWGAVGFRRSRVLTTVKGWTWKSVAEALRAARARKFLRVKRDVDKDAVKKAVADGGMPIKKLAQFGMAVQDRDTFGYELKSDEVEDRDAA